MDYKINETHNCNEPKILRGITIIVVLYMILFVVFFRSIIVTGDPVGYYSWVRSFIIDGDLNISNEFEHYNMGNFPKNLKGVYPAQPWAIGSAILWSPFFVIAHVTVILTKYIGLNLEPDGYSLLYRFMVGLGSTLYALSGLIIIYFLIRKYFEDKVAILSVISLWLASPLIYYMCCSPLYSHANDLFAYSLILLCWYRTGVYRRLGEYVLLGASAGLSAMIRTQNAIIVVFIVGYLIASVLLKKRRLREGLAQVIVFSLAWWVTFFPQLYVWKQTFGEWFPGSPYASFGGSFHFGFPWVLQVMFSDNRGLFVWHPLLLFGVLGWYFLIKKDQHLTLFFLASFILQLAIIGSWNSWHGAHAFGQRFFVNLVPAFMFGLAALLNEFKKIVSIKVITFFCLVFILWNFILIIQFALETVPREGPTNLSAFVKNQFLVIPYHITRILEAWWKRH